MSTPISGSTGTSLLNSLLSPSTHGHTAKAKPGQAGALSDASLPTTPDAATAALQAAVASVNQLTQAFDQAFQGASTVDPTTGLSELSSNASSQLDSALTRFLEQSGFSQQQAEAAATGFATQLANGGGGPVELDASYDDANTFATSMSASYGATTMSASSVALNERSGSVQIQFDPTSGKLSISLQEQQVSAVTSVTQITSANPLTQAQLALQPLTQPLGILNLLPSDSHGHDSSNDGNGAGSNNGQNASGQSSGNPANASSNDDTSTVADALTLLNGLLAGLGVPKLHSTQDALDQLSRMANAAQQNGAQPADDSTDGTQDPSALAVSIGFTQTLSISLLDLNGHGTTLFKRPDGSTGAMSFEQTHVEA
ncbi:hypothetical protein [Paraburkholderia solisilvae]|uniref:Uncharacterized protein n=1 Tax=Paraburkholderia solisilvae TaxID=624376 RepID=A0A6J5EII0_9BURK|nr:hypothetical protein [Paraburkholderia solisilvae]CAB3766278.1 hypothetical protein LMG29739_04782 [Paraburkholderia solisilvae]